MINNEIKINKDANVISTKYTIPIEHYWKDDNFYYIIYPKITGDNLDEMVFNQI